MIHHFNKLMRRKLLILLALLSLIFWNSSNVFGYDRCIYDDGTLIEDHTDDYKPNHICRKSGSNFCLFPISDNTLAFHNSIRPMDSIVYAKISDTKFHEKFDGCRLSIVDYPQYRIQANFNGDASYFTRICGGWNYFYTKMDITYEAYGKGNPVAQTQETKTNQKINISGYHRPLVAKINEFKTGVNSVTDYTYDRDIYTLRVKKAIITDNKCPPPKSKLKDRPISVATKLLLELKLNTDDRIVYDDKETKKIEVNADQDEFYFGGTPLIIDKQGLGTPPIKL